MISYRTIMAVLAVGVFLSIYIVVANLTSLPWAEVYLLLMLIYILGAVYSVYRATNRTSDVASRTIAAVGLSCLAFYVLTKDIAYIGGITASIIGIVGMVRVQRAVKSER